MDITAVIPARYDSSRFPGKPLIKILGKPMIQRVYEAVVESNLFDQVIVATDSDEIFQCVSSFSGKVAMTRKDHCSGTDRIWEVALKIESDAFVNIQGDEPLIDSTVLADICDSLNKHENIVTAAFFSQNYEWFMSPDHVKVVLDNNGYALYFSRSAIPYCQNSTFSGFFHHVGVYGFQKEALKRFVAFSKSSLENTETLEQLRLLQNGCKIKVNKTNYMGLGVDKPQDVAVIEGFLQKKMSIVKKNKLL